MKIKFPRQSQTIQLPGPEGILEAYVDFPQTNTNTNITEPQYVMICAHPHPLYGGTMHNKVVTTLAKVANHFAWPAVRFNYRGVGESTGHYAQAIGETEDLLAVMTWVKKALPSVFVILAGFSFGSYVVARGADPFLSSGTFLNLSHDAIAAVISIAPPVNHFDFSEIASLSLPWLMIHGDKDEVVPFAEVEDFWLRKNIISCAFTDFMQKNARAIDSSPWLTAIHFHDTSHFFHGKLVALREALIKWLSVYVLKANK